MAGLFKPGEPVRHSGGIGQDMLVEGYDEAGRVICSFWEGITRKQQAFSEDDLEKIPSDSPPSPP